VRLRVVALAFGLALSGCAAERASTPSTLLPADTPVATSSFKRAGMTVSLPRAMTVVERKSPAVFQAKLGEWFVSGLAYRRKEQLPRNDAELRAARRRLVREVRRRDRTFKVVSATTTRVDGARAVQVVGDQEISKQRLRIRSLHVYKGRGEYVLEMAAPVDEFGTLDRNVFDRVVKSLKVTGRPR
jgi:hypothetical protein